MVVGDKSTDEECSRAWWYWEVTELYTTTKESKQHEKANCETNLGREREVDREDSDSDNNAVIMERHYTGRHGRYNSPCVKIT